MSASSGLPGPAPTTNKPLTKKSSGGGNKKGTSAERRATHNAVERARRESLNVRFLELAANLPATCTIRRPSKSMIVNKSLEFVDQALNAESILRLKVEELIHENKSFLEELNEYRLSNGLSSRTSSIEADLPLPLAESDFKSNSQRANAALHRGSVTLGGDFDDDYSGQASNSSHSSSASPTEAHRTSSTLPTNGYQASPRLSQGSAQYFLDPSRSYHDNAQHQHSSGAFSLPNTYYTHAAMQQSQQQQSDHPFAPEQQQNSLHQHSSDFIPPITPTTASMFSQLLGSYTSSEGSTDHLPTHLPAAHHHDTLSNNNSLNPMGEPHQSAFAAMAFNTYSDHRYSNQPTSVSVSTPTSTPYTTAV